VAKYLGSSFLTDVRGVLLTGLSTATNAAIAATDSVLGAFGKLQAQINGEVTARTNADALLAPKASPSFTGTVSSTGSFVSTLASGGIEIGGIAGTGNAPFVDFHSSGNNTDYDARLIASGGTTTIGLGDLTVAAGTFSVPTIASSADSTNKAATTAFVQLLTSGATFAANVRGVLLTGLSTATNAAVTATDSVLGAFGKLQAQITGEVSRATAAEGLLAPKAGPSFTGAVVNTTGSFYTIGANTGLELGSTSASNFPFVDFHSSGGNIDFDARILASGGNTTTTGLGDLTVTAGTFSVPTVASSADSTNKAATTAFVQLLTSGATFATNVRAVVLTGLSTATNAAITATDSVLGAFGKLQAQITGEVSARDGSRGVCSRPRPIPASPARRPRSRSATWLCRRAITVSSRSARFQG
jgi:hypothetical protein